MAETATASKDQVASFETFLLEQELINSSVFEKITEFKKTPAWTKQLQASSPVEGVLVFLEAQKIYTAEDSAKARAAFYNLPYIDLRKAQIPKSAVGLMPAESLAFYRIAPFKLGTDHISIAVFDPSNLQTLQALEFLGQKQNLQVEVYVASSESIETLTGQKKQLKNVVGKALEDIESKEAKAADKEGKKKERLDESVLKDAPIVKIVDVMLVNAIEGGASDIHIEPSEKEVRIRYRIDGQLHNSLVLPRTVHAAIVTRIKILCNMKIDETRLPQDGRFHFETEDKSVDLRVSVIPLIYGEKIVMRILDKTGSVPTLEDLGVSGINLKWITDNIKKPHGIFLITGPTGSGKSTTLYSLLSLLNTIGTNIITLEDPVEYFMQGVNQSQINPDIGFTFASGLRSILRQDPNIIMVGEIRDTETAELSVHAALTGHLVFSTLHTNNSVGAMPRLIDMGIEKFLLAASVNVVVAQRLVRKACDNCIGPDDEISDVIVKSLYEEVKDVPKEFLEGVEVNNLKVYKGKGCDVCDNTGSKGRLGIFEVLPVTIEVQQLMLSNAPAEKYLDVAKKMGMITLRQDGIIKAFLGKTSIEEVLRVTTE
ncbi:MAG TPA: GspE/PulE family protein [Patescibacteria group bacterium]|nr:GspE/PulE family protein [Patescibacteria group bacterium]